ncbi:MAG: hypothetical protein L0Z50_31030 [Verrucomicrobiales bacterium]|nr:hypothetical protein [Verrucomicrobiales bacterium]
MKLSTHLGLLPLLLVIPALGQGTILFDTHVPGRVDARVVDPTGGILLGWTAQLVFQPEDVSNPPISLLPITTFKTAGPASDVGYVNPVVVTVPGSGPGSRGFVYMRVASQDPRGCFATGGLTTITLGEANSPAFLDGLPGMDAEVICIPEPSTFALGAVGALLFIGCGQRAHARRPK